jgi:aspartate/methionine/tyrosine aminotransferase
MPIEIESPEQMGYSNVKFNLTESSYTDLKFGDLNLNINELPISYGHHVGHEGLRAILAKEFKLKSEDILLTAGAATGLFIIATSLLEKGDQIVVTFPNYGTNIETPKAIGAEIVMVDQKLEDHFQLNVDQIRKAVTAKTKLISITSPHNPTGVIVKHEDILEVIKIAESFKCPLLIDETYRDLQADEKIRPLYATLSPWVISVSSLSKAYGLPGIRIGWIACQNKELQNLFLAAKEQIMICNSILDEEIAFQFYQKIEKFRPQIQKNIQEKTKIVTDWLKTCSFFECAPPEGGVVCFPRFKKEINYDRFYKILNEKYSTYVGPGHWFDMSKRYMRVGFGWPSVQELKTGLSNLEAAYKEVSEGKN